MEQSQPCSRRHRKGCLVPVCPCESLQAGARRSSSPKPTASLGEATWLQEVHPATGGRSQTCIVSGAAAKRPAMLLVFRHGKQSTHSNRTPVGMHSPTPSQKTRKEQAYAFLRPWQQNMSQKNRKPKRPPQIDSQSEPTAT